MGEYYAECRKPHEKMGWNFDGCQEFKPSNYHGNHICDNCRCSWFHHRKVVAKKKVVEYKKEVVYTRCHKIHVQLHNSVDGCQEFVPAGAEAEAEPSCAACGCHKSFHRIEITTTQTTTSTQ